MNKKIYAGIVAFGVAASFWACGSGDIIKPSVNDTNMLAVVADAEGGGAVYISALDSLCPECLIVSTPSSSSRRTPVARSSSSRTSNLSSSSQIIINTSSSAGPGYDYSSSSSLYSGPISSATSSSSVIAGPGSEAGTCGPEKAVVESGEKVTWVFSNESKTFPGGLMLKSTFIWTTPGGNPATATISNYNGKSIDVDYATSGKHNATLHIDVTGGNSYDLTCTPVQVNGAPITGCKCAPVGVTGSVNYLKTPNVAWAVTGCSTGTGLTLSYSWDGGAAGAETSYTKTFTGAAASAAPTLVVANDDNTENQVTCSPVKVTEGEEFTIKTSTDKVVFKESGSFAISANLPNGWHNADTECNVFCQAQTSNFTVTIDEIVLSGKVSGQNYVTKGGLPVAHTVGGYTIPVTVEIAEGDSVTCGVNW